MSAKKFNPRQRKLIANFCGIGDVAEPPPVPVPHALGTVLSEAIKKAVQNSNRLKLIRNSWRGTVGAKMAAFSRAKNFDRATLSIEVSNGVILQELKFNEQKILNAFAKNNGTKCVKKLKFIFVPGGAGSDFPS
jgi:hypothetical protein